MQGENTVSPMPGAQECAKQRVNVYDIWTVKWRYADRKMYVTRNKWGADMVVRWPWSIIVEVGSNVDRIRGSNVEREITM